MTIEVGNRGFVSYIVCIGVMSLFEVSSNDLGISQFE